MIFQGRVLPLADMLELASSRTPAVVGAGVGVLHTAADNARTCRDLIAGGESLDAAWRFGVLQTLDDYQSVSRRAGVDVAAGVFAEEPEPTGSSQVDAAFAALAAHLALRDGWVAPSWVDAPTRRAEHPWFPAVPEMWRADACEQSPAAFRCRGVFITERSLNRA